MASIDIKAMTGLVSAIGDAVSNLPYDEWGMNTTLGSVDVDSSPSSGIGKVSAWAEGAVPGLKRRLALAQAIEAKHPSFQGVVKIDESKLSNLDPTAAQNRGAADAKKLKDSNGKLDKDLLAEIAKYKDDPYFAAGFAENATPAELAQVVLAASRQRDTLEQYPGPDSQQDLKDWKANYGTLLDAVGTTIATATRNTGSLALPSDYAKQWTDTITADTYPDGGKAPYGQGAAASVLLRSGNFSTNFLDTVSTGVYNYEREHGKDGPVWKPRSWADTTFEGPYLPDGTQISDPLANIMHALGHNADAAQHFFSGGGDEKVKINGHDVPVNDRMKYLIEDRTWATGDGSDNGAGFGHALQAASTFYRDNSAAGQVSAKIAAETFALIGSHTGAGKSDGGLFGIGSHQGWKMWDGMRTSVANMVASYAPDLIRIAGVHNPGPTDWNGMWVVSDPGNSLFPPNGPASAWMDPTLMKNIIGTLGEDSKNMDIVNAGIAASGRIMLSYAAQRGMKIDGDAAAHIIAGTKGVPSLTGAAGALALTLNFAITAGYHGDKDQQAFEKERAENISKILGIVTSVPSLELPEGHEWTGFLIDQIKDQALDKIGEGPDQNAQDTYNDTSSDYQTKLQQMTLNALLDNGYFSDQNYAKANSPSAPHEFLSPLDPKYSSQDPPAVSKDADGHLRFNYDSQAYHDWEQDGQAMNSWIGNNVTGPFRENLPAYGG